MSHRAIPGGPAGRRVARVRSGVARLFGFGLSVVVLALASLLAIPAMVAASGEVAWGAIVLGQSIGGVGAVIVGYGWGLTGPAKIAGNGATLRRAEYIESLLVKLTLLLPVAAIAALLAFVTAPSGPLYAVVGAIASTSSGLTAAWYFVGVARPYAMLILETLPRAVGTAAGIVLMNLGYSAIAGVGCIFLGIMAGVAISAAWVFGSTTREGADHVPRRSLLSVLKSQRHGIASNAGTAAYSAAPLMIVSVVAPAAQPVFALVDKIWTQVIVALAPVCTVLQGWVPRATGPARAHRARVALAATSGFVVLLFAGTIAIAPILTNWLGHGEITVPLAVIIVMAAVTAADFYELVLRSAVLAAFERLDVAVRALIVSSTLSLPLIAVGAVFFGPVGAVTGILFGFIVCIAIECSEYVRSIKPLGRDLEQSVGLSAAQFRGEVVTDAKSGGRHRLPDDYYANIS